MWLFDNIFLDQNTQTAMLDPLVKPEEKELTKAKPEENNATSWETLEAASFDALMTPDTSSEKKEESIPTVNPDHAAIDEVSFDIWGIDLPSFDTQSEPQPEVSSGGTFLSGGTALSGVPEVSFGDTIDTAFVTTPETTPEISIVSEAEESPASIALVQSATAVSSDAIVSPIGGSIQIESEEVLESPVVPEVNIDTLSTNVVSDSASSESDGIFGLMNTTDVPTQAVEIAVSEAKTFVTTEPPVTLSLDTSASPLFSTPVEEVVTKVDTMPVSLESVSNGDLDPRDVLPEIKTDDVIASIAPTSHADDSLQDMLQEFVGKLEKFKTENGDVDTEMSEWLKSIQQSRKELEEEHRVRLLALEYQEKSIREKWEKRIAEQRRLEKIIANLKNEMKI